FAALAVMGIVLLARVRSLRLSLLVLALFFIGSAVRVRDHVLVPWSNHWVGTHQLPSALRALPTTEPVTYDADGFDPTDGNFYQFLLADRDVRFWRSSSGTPAPSTLVISSRH